MYVTQLPLEDTRSDFWCLIHDFTIPIILAMEAVDEQVQC